MADPQEAPKLEFTPEVFDPKKAELTAIAAEVAQITADPSKMTKEDFELINSTKNKLVKARTRISKAGLAAREAANQYNRDVLAYEKELIAIIEPEEKRLKEIEAAAKEYAMKEERLKTLPEFKEKLAAIGDAVEVSDDELLALDPNGRTEYYNSRLSAKLEADKAAADALRAEEDAKRAAEDKRQADERERIENEKKRIQDEKTNSRIQSLLMLGYRRVADDIVYDRLPDARTSKHVLEVFGDEEFNGFYTGVAKMIDEDKKKQADEAEAKRQEDIRLAAEQAKKEAEEAEAKRKADEETEVQRKAAEEKAAEEDRARAAAYQAFLNENSYNAETDLAIFEGGITVLYRKIASYQHPTE